MKKMVVVSILILSALLPLSLYGLSKPSGLVVAKINDTYTIPDDIATCPICLLRDYIVIEDNVVEGIIQIRCTNPYHYNMIVITGGNTYQEAIRNWNLRGTCLHEH